MYIEVTKEDTIRIPPEYLRKGVSLTDHIDRLASRSFEGRFDEENRLIVVTYDHETLGRGRIIHGDGAIYQPIRFKAILFEVADHEVVEGAVSEVSEFGAFVRIGPLEALLHLSQIMEDRVNVNVGAQRIEGATTGLSLGEFTTVRARIVQAALNNADPRSSKIGVTCKQPGLGALEWLED